jgi:hypothetical protein
MHTLSRLIRRLSAWLSEPSAVLIPPPAEICWADLPPHHPRSRD